MNYLTIKFPIVTMRKIPREQSPIVSQACFSEHVLVKKAFQNWRLIITLDGYTGWVPFSSFIKRKTPYICQEKVSRIRAHLYEKPTLSSELILTLPYGSKLQLLKRINERWLQVKLPDDRNAYIQRGDIGKESKELIQFCKKFLKIPYVWGGRSSFGYDCSGFVQMVYQKFGIQLPRDSYLQYRDPRGFEVTIDQLQKGDLIFWGASDKAIKHVGIFLEENRFIHTSSRENMPFLRMSQLTDPFWNAQFSNEYPFRVARRFFHNF